MRELAYLRPGRRRRRGGRGRRPPQRACSSAGGTNLVDHLKLGVTAPELLVDVRGLPLDDIVEHDGHDGPVLRVGAAVRNSDLAAHPLVRSRVPRGDAGAARRRLAADPAPGHHRRQPAPADPLRLLPGRHHAVQQARARHRLLRARGLRPLQRVLGASDDCVAVHPSDLAVALAAVDAVVVVLGADGERRIPLVDLHRLPGDRPDLDTTLSRGDLVTAVEIPLTPPGPAVDVPQGPRPGVVRLRTGLRGRRPRPRRRHRPRRTHRLGRHRPQAVAGHPRRGRAPRRDR